MIERVFSRLYKYLQFKSTTGEVFQRHINIDSGYKYLSSDSIRHSDKNTRVYYDDDPNDPDNTLGYLRYMKKLSEYANSDILTNHEKTVLGHFMDILRYKARSWITDNVKWDLCPLCHVKKPHSPRRLAKTRDENSSNGQSYGSLFIDFNLSGVMDWDGDAAINVYEVPDAKELVYDQQHRPSSLHIVPDSS